ncbi:unnamed protein product [Rotaria sordida]|uniref:Uncharacterized protein n=2 Tax=Rotaria sordida TaxID=392033 RepID=A0A818LSR3_9BILA|nr:unnamed protein product [Rotaria sordida]
MILIGICLQRFLLHLNGNVLSKIQYIISCITSGILLGTLLMIILPNSLELVAYQWHTINMGYLLIGLGFFLICIIQELTNLFELYLSKRQNKNEQEKLIDSSVTSHHNHQLGRLVTIVFGLGVHYFFNGILIGGQTKDTATLWLLLGAICFHMSLLAFSVTLRLLINNKNYFQVFCAMSIWSIMGPIGVFVGLLVSSDSSELNLINGILQCLSAGIFIYITFIDMIRDDLMKTELYPFINIILIFVGFLIIVLTSLSHNHTH